MNFDSNAFVCNVNYWEGHLFRHIDYRDPQSYNLCGTSLLLESNVNASVVRNGVVHQGSIVLTTTFRRVVS